MKVENSIARVGLGSPRKLKIPGALVTLRGKKLSDARDDYRWQSDPELAKLDAAEPVLLSFAVYLMDYSVELQSPRYNRYPLAIDTPEGRHIGNCTVYDIDERNQEAQVGILIGDRDYWNKGYGTDALNTMVDFLYHNATLSRLYLKTLDWNERAQKSFLKTGFQPAGTMKKHGYDFRLMELTREQWEALPRRIGAARE